MPTAPKLVAAIDAAVLAAEESQHRNHLGASVIGRKCAREIWYKFRWALPYNPHEARLLRLFHRGHREEPELIALLRAAGVTVWAAGETGELKEQMRITDHAGHFGGTPDGIGKGIPDLPADMVVLLEFKTFNDKQFQKLKVEGLMQAKWEYFVQMQIYMEKHQLPAALFMGVNKNDDELFLELVRYDSEVANKYLNRAGEIIWALEPPQRISESPGWFECKFCDMREICHFNAPVARNCRTCEHVRPTAEGKWHCLLHAADIPDPAVPCGQYRVNDKIPDDIPF